MIIGYCSDTLRDECHIAGVRHAAPARFQLAATACNTGNAAATGAAPVQGGMKRTTTRNGAYVHDLPVRIGPLDLWIAPI